MPGIVLHRADGVEGDGGAGHEGPAGLDEEPHLHTGGVQRLAHDLAPLGDVGRRLAFHIGHAQTAAHGEARQFVGGDQLGHDLGRQGEGLGGEDLAADVGVQPDQLDGGRSPRPVDGALGHATGEAEAELGVGLAGADVLVGVGLDAGRDPQLHPRHRVRRRGAARAVELVEAVDDDVVHAGGQRGGQLGRDLLLPWSTSRSAGTPAASATCISPPVATSSNMPSSCTRRAMARQRKALVA